MKPYNNFFKYEKKKSLLNKQSGSGGATPTLGRAGGKYKFKKNTCFKHIELT